LADRLTYRQRHTDELIQTDRQTNW